MSVSQSTCSRQPGSLALPSRKSDSSGQNRAGECGVPLPRDREWTGRYRWPFPGNQTRFLVSGGWACSRGPHKNHMLCTCDLSRFVPFHFESNTNNPDSRQQGLRTASTVRSRVPLGHLLFFSSLFSGLSCSMLTSR